MTPRTQFMDVELALSRVGGDTELLREIAVIFMDDYPKVVAEVRDAASRGDAKAIERAAHGLKGSVSNFGAPAAVNAASRLELMGRTGELENVSASLSELERVLASLHEDLVAL